MQNNDPLTRLKTEFLDMLNKMNGDDDIKGIAQNMFNQRLPVEMSESFTKSFRDILISMVNPRVDYLNINPTFLKIALSVAKPVDTENIIDTTEVLQSKDSDKKIISDLKRNPNYHHYNKKFRNRSDLQKEVMQFLSKKDCSKNIIELVERYVYVDKNGIGIHSPEPQYIFEWSLIALCMGLYMNKATVLFTRMAEQISLGEYGDLQNDLAYVFKKASVDPMTKVVCLSILVEGFGTGKSTDQISMITMIGIVLREYGRNIPKFAVLRNQIYENFQDYYTNNRINESERLSKLKQAEQSIEEFKVALDKYRKENIFLNKEAENNSTKIQSLTDKLNNAEEKLALMRSGKVEKRIDDLEEKLSLAEKKALNYQDELRTTKKAFDDLIKKNGNNDKNSISVEDVGRIYNLWEHLDETSKSKLIQSIAKISMEDKNLIPRIQSIADEYGSSKLDRFLARIHFNFEEKQMEAILANDRVIELNEFIGNDVPINEERFAEGQIVLVENSGLVLYKFPAKHLEEHRYYGVYRRYGQVDQINNRWKIHYGNREFKTIPKTNGIKLRTGNIYIADDRNNIIGYCEPMRSTLDNYAEWIEFNGYHQYIVTQVLEGQGVLVRDITTDQSRFITLSENQMDGVYESCMIITNSDDGIVVVLNSFVYTKSEMYNNVRYGVVEYIEDNDIYAKYQNGEIKIVECTDHYEFKVGDAIKVDEFEQFIDFCDDFTILRDFGAKPVNKKSRVASVDTSKLVMKDEKICLITDESVHDTYKLRFLKNGYELSTVDGDASIADIKKAAKGCDLIVLNTASCSHTVRREIIKEYGDFGQDGLIQIHTRSAKVMLEEVTRHLEEVKSNVM